MGFFILAFALKCWECNGKTDFKCNDQFDSNRLDKRAYVDCVPVSQNDRASCFKAKGKFVFEL